VEVLIGRSLAFFVHPAAAWRRLSLPGRAGLVGAYFSAAYLVVLIFLLAL